MAFLHPELKKLKAGRQYMMMAVLGLAGLVVWMIAEVFTVYQKSPITADLRESAIPLTPVLDEVALREIQQRRAYSDEELADFTIYRVLQSDANQGSEVVAPVGQTLIESTPPPQRPPGNQAPTAPIATTPPAANPPTTNAPADTP
jgi:hypothetical protein